MNIVAPDSPAGSVSAAPEARVSSYRSGDGSHPADTLKTIDIRCAGCGGSYPIPKKEATRRRQPVHGHFCSKRCRRAHRACENIAGTVALWIEEPWLQEAYADAYRHARKGAAKRGIVFDYSKEDYNAAIRAGQNRCALSGIEFEDAPRSSKHDRRPFIPSIDRIDSTRGYTKDNVRIVCSIANLAMNTGGSAPLERLAWHIVAQLSGIDAAAVPAVLTETDTLKERIRTLEARLAQIDTRAVKALRQRASVPSRGSRATQRRPYTESSLIRTRRRPEHNNNELCHGN